jgi:hypothetical protein
MLEYLRFFVEAEKRQLYMIRNSHKIPQVRQNQLHSQIIEVRHMQISSVSAVLCSTDGYAPMISSFSTPKSMHFDLGSTAKSRSFAHVCVHRRRVHRYLAFGVSQVHRLVHHLQTSHFMMAELLELRVQLPQNEHAY